MGYIYIAGPMKGYSDDNQHAFISAARDLRSHGYDVYNPVEGGAKRAWRPSDFTMLSQADSILALPGWESADGSRLEVAIGVALDLDIVAYDYTDDGWDFEDAAVLHFEGGYADLLTDIEPVDDGVHLPTANTPLAVPADTSEPAEDTDAEDIGADGDYDVDEDDSSDPRDEESPLDEAYGLVMGPRQDDYGHPYEDFTRTAAMWSAIFGFQVSAEEVALAMVAVKISREVNRPKRDNIVDAMGYLQTLHMVRQRRIELDAAERYGPTYGELSVLPGGKTEE